MGKGTSLNYSDRSDVGRRRANNQDSRSVLEPSGPAQYRTRGWLFLVADGMGAHAAGEMASGIAAERVPLAYEKAALHSPPLALRQSIEQTNAEINAKGESVPEFNGMGTTCTVLVLLPRGAIVGHIGDSRAYRVRSGKIEQLSKDHSLVWELEAAAGTAGEPFTGGVPKNIITRSMGPHPHVKVDLEGPYQVAEGDTFLLCSDGLSGQVADEEIGLLAAELEPAAATAALVGLSLVRGAPDNVTVIAVRAGAEEVSHTSVGDPPWQLSDEPAASAGRGGLPWRWLLVAAASLFAMLVLIGFAGGVPAALAPPLDLSKFVLLALAGVAFLSFLASLLAAFLGFLTSSSGDARYLAPGRQIGQGPYRSADCSPSESLIERVVASVESAAGGLSDGDRERTTSILGRIRRHVAERSFHEAVVALSEALSIYTKAVEQARSDETTAGPAASESP